MNEYSIIDKQKVIINVSPFLNELLQMVYSGPGDIRDRNCVFRFGKNSGIVFVLQGTPEEVVKIIQTKLDLAKNSQWTLLNTRCMDVHMRVIDDRIVFKFSNVFANYFELIAPLDMRYHKYDDNYVFSNTPGVIGIITGIVDKYLELKWNKL